jgi:hypothetical protein
LHTCAFEHPGIFAALSRIGDTSASAAEAEVPGSAKAAEHAIAATTKITDIAKTPLKDFSDAIFYNSSVQTPTKRGMCKTIKNPVT